MKMNKVLFVICDEPYIRICKKWFWSLKHIKTHSLYLGFLAIDWD